MSSTAREMQVSSEVTAVADRLERLALDPNIEPTKLRELMDLQDRWMDRQAKQAFAAAFVEMQGELPIITERGAIEVDGKTRSTYARFEDIVEVSTPILQRHGFSLSFRYTREDGQDYVVAVLTHRDGHSEQTMYPFEADKSGGKQGAQALASGSSYAKRYAMNALLNIVTRGQDDDGYSVSFDLLSEEQVTVLTDLLTELPKDRQAKFLKWGKVDRVSQIRAAAYEDCKRQLERARRDA